MVIVHSIEVSDHWLKRLIRFILFGNYFLAFCIVALSIETTVKNGFFITDVTYYGLIFLSVVVYYTHAYINDNELTETSNLRSRWYSRNRLQVRFTQIIFTCIILCLGIYLGIKYFPLWYSFTTANWLTAIVFPLIALLYYGVIFPAWFRLRLRNIAWLKPFIIAFVCTGMIVVYPLLFYSLQQRQPFHVTTANGCYFLTNWLYTTAIAIMFDIKDFAADHNYKLKTFVVTKGLRYTIFLILLPLSVASFASFFLFASIRHFSLLQILINMVPFVLLLLATASFRRRKGILYYLIVIDGLLLIKALFGIGAMLLAS